MKNNLTDRTAGGGAPVRLPYARQWIEDDDIEAVVAALRSDWLTTGPHVERFERAFAAAVGAREAVAVSSGTAALHAAMHAIGVGPGDEVVVPAMTFAATANAVVLQGGTPVFADVDEETLLLSPGEVERRVTPRTRAVVAVDYAGHPCDYDALGAVAGRHGLALLSDACHALGGRYRGRSVGALAAASAFSLHAVKHVTAGEGGVVTTGDAALARRARLFRNHGIASDARLRDAAGSWFYEMVELGCNYRLTDLQCALATTQLAKLGRFLQRRREIARRYDAALGEIPGVRPLGVRPDVEHARHLYVVRLDPALLGLTRADLFAALRAEGIGVNVHYVPVHLHPFYRRRFGTGPGLCPVAEAAYERILTLPLFPRMTDADVDRVLDALRGLTRPKTRRFAG